MSGAIIPPGDHILTNLIYSGSGTCEACIENVTLSDQMGNDLVVNIGACISIENSMPGDVNEDGLVNVIDVIQLVNLILNGIK